MDKNLITIYRIIWNAYNESSFLGLLKFILKTSKFRMFVIILLFLLLLISLFSFIYFYWKNKIDVATQIYYSLPITFLFIFSFIYLNRAIEESFKKNNINIKNYQFIENENRAIERYLLFSLKLKKENISKRDIMKLLNSDLFSVEKRRKEKSILELIKNNLIVAGSFTVFITMLSGLSSIKEYWDNKINHLLLLTAIFIMIISIYILMIYKYSKMSRREKIEEMEKFLIIYINENQD